MKRLMVVLAALLWASPAFAQIGGSPGISNPQMQTTYSASNPTGTCPAQGRWFNTATLHEWICNNSGTWLDLVGAGTSGADAQIYQVGPTSTYTTIKAALDAINVDAAGRPYEQTNYVVRIAAGTYSDNLTLTNEKYLRLEGAGVFVTGTVTFTQTQQGGDYYSRVEFAGTEGFRAEKGPAFKLAGNLAGTRNNDSLTYLTFRGVWLTGNLSWSGDGTPVVQFYNSRVAGTLSATGFSDPDSTMLVESDNTEFAGAISQIVSLYNIRDSDFYGAITTTPWYANRVVNSDFHSSVSIIPQGGAAETTIYLDPATRATLPAAPVFTGATLVDLAGDPFPLNRVYVVDPTWGPYRTVKAALDRINVVAPAESSYLNTNYTIKIHPGTYSDALTFTNYKHLRLEAVAGYVELSGTIAFTQTQQGGDYYSRVEFVGIDGFRAEKGPSFKISGAMAGTRNNDSLTYLTFKGVWITGAFTWDGDGTPVVQFFGCRESGTIDSVTLADPDSTILVESDWTEFAGAITDKVSLYNVRNSDFYGAINTTPWYGSTFFNTGFHSTVSIVPQGGAPETTVNLDGNSFKSLAIRTPTLTGVTVVNMDLYSLSPTIPDGGVGATPTPYTLEPRGAESVFLTCADADGCTVTMGEQMAVAGQKLVIVNLGANDITLVDDDGTTAELDGDANYVLDVQLESVTLVYTGTYWLQTGFLDPS